MTKSYGRSWPTSSAFCSKAGPENHFAQRFTPTKGTLCHLRDDLEEMLPDVMMESADEDSLPGLLLRKSAVLAGPGMGTGPEVLQVLEQVVAQTAGPLLLDADALTLLAAHPQLASQALGRLVLTPHPGEMARLLGLDTAEIEADRLGSAQEAAERWQAVVVRELEG